MASKLLNGNSFYMSEIGLYRKTDSQFIIFQCDTNGSKEGWLLRTENTKNKIGSYGRNWNKEFTSRILLEDLTEAEKETLNDIIRGNFKPGDMIKVYKKLNIPLPQVEINVVGNIIDIEGYIMFNVLDVKLVEYVGLDLKLIFKDCEKEYIIPNSEKIKSIILEGVSGSKKVMI